MGKIATKLDAQTLRQDVLPTTLALCQDIDWEVRHLMCRHLALIARGVGQDTTKSLIMPQIVELSSDEISDVRLAAMETVVDLLTVNLLDEESRTQIIVPLVIKSCDQVKEYAFFREINFTKNFVKLISRKNLKFFFNFFKNISCSRQSS